MLRLVLATAVLANTLVLASTAGLADDRIVGESSLSLDGTWKLTSESSFTDEQYSITGSVPGDLITDLQNAGLVGDPLYELNWLNATMWNGYSWKYTKSVTMTDADLTRMTTMGTKKILVFDGIKMGASIAVNGKTLGQATDQFRRYEFELAAADLQSGNNEVSVTFMNSIDCGGRWMACTGGWDWAPYTNTNQDGINTFTKGMWKNVYIVDVADIAVMHMVPQIFYKGEYPTSPLADGNHGGFDVSFRLHLWAPAATKVTVGGDVSWGASVPSTEVPVPAGESSVTVTTQATASQIKLWWPAGHGAQPLYNITAKVSGGGSTLSITRRVGFRMFALVTGNDTDPSYVAANKDKDGTDSMGMLWRVNGAVIWSKGANMIPMEELEGRMAANAHTQLVKHAVAGGLNTLRVWGGGMFLPSAWYDACDELGIMVYHDMQYAQNGHSPSNTTDQDAELRHQIRRLSHHPAIVMWDGCNECRVIIGTPTGIYATFVMTVVAQEDKSRAIWPSCPALGWTGGVNRLTSMPNGKPLTTPPKGITIETHGPYQHGTGFPAVNGNPSEQMFDANIPINVNDNSTGAGLNNVFASEFGSSVYSSFESMSPTLDPKHWGVHGGSKPDQCKGGFASKCEGDNVMAQRNYPCDNIIEVYFGKQDLNATGEQVFKKQLWHCMVGQALLIKQNIETRRSNNQFGVIVWQFNEIWPTGGWGSIEYGTVGYTKGQVLGGRWKPLQYWYKQSIYADVMATCGAGGTCYVKNDAPVPFSGEVKVVSVNFATSEIKTLYSKSTSLAAGAGTKEMFSVSAIDGTSEILLSTVTKSTGEVLSSHAIPYAAPKDMKLPMAKVSIDVAEKVNADGTVDVVVTTDKFALYVTLTTLAQGYFSENTFVMAGAGKKTVQFIPVEGFDMGDLKSLRVEHAAMYM